MKQRFFFVVLATLNLLAAIASSPAFAEADAASATCSHAVLKIVGEHFGLDAFDFPRDNSYPSVENGALIVAGACKSSPTNNNEVIAAFAYDSGIEKEKELLVAVLDQQKHKVISSYSYKYFEEPGGIGSVGIDTARYTVSSGVRAFGVYIARGYSPNCGDGDVGNELTLYVQDGASIRPILYIPVMSSWRFIKGNHTGCGPDTGLEIIENTAITLKMLGSETNGYKDILITSSSDRSDGKPSSTKKARYTYRYNGKEYVSKQAPW